MYKVVKIITVFHTYRLSAAHKKEACTYLEQGNRYCITLADYMSMYFSTLVEAMPIPTKEAILSSFPELWNCHSCSVI